MARKKGAGMSGSASKGAATSKRAGFNIETTTATGRSKPAIRKGQPPKGTAQGERGRSGVPGGDRGIKSGTFRLQGGKA